jgi:hypothetical protein
MQDSDELIEAVKAHDLDRVRSLLDRGSPVDVRDDEGRTPLMWAARQGHFDTAKLLIGCGADVNAKNNRGFVPLMSAASKPTIARLLLEAGAEADIKDDYRQTPLMSAVQSDCVEVAKMLLEKGADPMALDMFGDSPFSYAERNGKNRTLEAMKAVTQPTLSQAAQTSSKSPRGKWRIPIVGGIIARQARKKELEGLSDKQIIEALRTVSRRLDQWKPELGEKQWHEARATAREIGTELYRRGGDQLMHRSYRECGGNRALETAWDNIGEWRG